MEVNVLLFGPAARAVGVEAVAVRVAAGATCADVAAALIAAQPRLIDYVTSGRLAVNHSFASSNHPVHEGDEVALIAMVSGG